MKESSTYKEVRKDKEMCQCRSCGSVFHQSEIVKEDRQRKCPSCGSSSHGVMIYPYDEEYNTYKYPSFYYRSK